MSSRGVLSPHAQPQSSRLSPLPSQLRWQGPCVSPSLVSWGGMDASTGKELSAWDWGGPAAAWQLGGAPTPRGSASLSTGPDSTDALLSPGLSMRLLESRKGLSCFAFEHSEEYQQTQLKFLSAVESMEPNNIVVRAPPTAQRPSVPPQGAGCGPGDGGGVRLVIRICHQVGRARCVLGLGIRLTYFPRGLMPARGPGCHPGRPCRQSPQLPAPQVLLQTSPYHVDSLLQLSDACRFQDDQETARDLVGEHRSCLRGAEGALHSPRCGKLLLPLSFSLLGPRSFSCRTKGTRQLLPPRPQPLGPLCVLSLGCLLWTFLICGIM